MNASANTDATEYPPKVLKPWKAMLLRATRLTTFVVFSFLFFAELRFVSYFGFTMQTGVACVLMVCGIIIVWPNVLEKLLTRAVPFFDTGPSV